MELKQLGFLPKGISTSGTRALLGMLQSLAKSHHPFRVRSIGSNGDLLKRSGHDDINPYYTADAISTTQLTQISQWYSLFERIPLQNTILKAHETFQLAPENGMGP